MYTELHQSIPVTIPQGPGFAIGVIDMGQEHHLLWVVVADETGEIWCVGNPDVRVRPNYSMRAPRTIPIKEGAPA
jgi:hypothetical protein